MYVRNSIVTTDSSVYDSKNRRILEFGMWGKGEIFLQNQSTYLGDSIKKCVIIVKRNSWNKEMDTTYKTEYFNNKNQLVELSVLSSLNKSLYHNQYFYSEGGLVEKIKNLAAGYAAEFIDIRHQIHANPELSYEEFETSKFIQQKLGDWKG